MEHSVRQCKVCLETKPITEFYRDCQRKDLTSVRCKTCASNKSKRLRSLKPEQYKESRKKHYQRNQDKMREMKRNYGADHRKEKQSYDIVYRQQNKDKIAQYKKEWEKTKKNDPLFKICRNLRRRIHHLVKDGYKSGTTEKLLGCSFEKFKEYLENRFEPGMSWENYSTKGWHIDHIIPCYEFNLLDPQEQRLCFHYMNMRPLWAKDNLKRPRSIKFREDLETE